MYYCKINKKSVLCIEGKDTLSFLQGLITNNIDKLKVNRVIYTTLLSPQGKLLHDFFLIKEKEMIDEKGFFLNRLIYDEIISTFLINSNIRKNIKKNKKKKLTLISYFLEII